MIYKKKIESLKRVWDQPTNTTAGELALEIFEGVIEYHLTSLKEFTEIRDELLKIKKQKQKEGKRR